MTFDERYISWDPHCVILSSHLLTSFLSIPSVLFSILVSDTLSLCFTFNVTDHAKKYVHIFTEVERQQINNTDVAVWRSYLFCYCWHFYRDVHSRSGCAKNNNAEISVRLGRSVHFAVLNETFELLDSLNFWYIRYRVMPKWKIIIIIIPVITCMQGIYNYIPVTMFLGYIELQLLCIYNLCYM